MTELAGPGVRRMDVVPPPPPVFTTGVPAFLGTTVWAPDQTGQSPPVLLGGWPQFISAYGGSLAPTDGETAAERVLKDQFASAIEGFFAGGGTRCWLAPVDPAADRDEDPTQPERTALAGLAELDDVDLIAAPELVLAPITSVEDPALGRVIAVQRALLDHCAGRADRFALLDSIRDPGLVQTQATGLRGPDGGYGALYHPWLQVPADGGTRFVPPCGQVAGSYARTDGQQGVHRSPANVALPGVLDTEYTLDDRQIGRLSEFGVNCLRARPQRGIRAWGARTLSDDPARASITVPRLLGMVRRWLRQFMTTLAFEPNDVRLWVRVMREVTAYLDRLHRIGALAGRTPEEAFFVKCDTETNPRAVIDAGLVVTQIGLAPAVPAEFIVVRVVQDAYSTSIDVS